MGCPARRGAAAHSFRAGRDASRRRGGNNSSGAGRESSSTSEWGEARIDRAEVSGGERVVAELAQGVIGAA
jgi:hypothetical protein